MTIPVLKTLLLVVSILFIILYVACARGFNAIIISLYRGDDDGATAMLAKVYGEFHDEAPFIATALVPIVLIWQFIRQSISSAF